MRVMVEDQTEDIEGDCAGLFPDDDVCILCSRARAEHLTDPNDNGDNDADGE